VYAKLFPLVSELSAADIGKIAKPGNTANFSPQHAVCFPLCSACTALQGVSTSTFIATAYIETFSQSQTENTSKAEIRPGTLRRPTCDPRDWDGSLCPGYTSKFGILHIPYSVPNSISVFMPRTFLSFVDISRR